MANSRPNLVDLQTWGRVQREIAECNQCLNRWPNHITKSLSLGEIPNPPSRIKVLFIGVAPTPQLGNTKGGHFYSSPSDLLRRGLFSVIQGILKVSLNAHSLNDGTQAFMGLNYFFIHCAKVRPIREPAPPKSALLFCAQKHLCTEIQALNPGGICFLGKNNAGPVAEEIFRRKFGTDSVHASIDDWHGWVAVAPQPRRGWEPQTKIVVQHLLEKLDEG